MNMYQPQTSCQLCCVPLQCCGRFTRLGHGPAATPVCCDLPSPWALRGQPAVPNLPECTLFPARIPDTEHTPGTPSKPRQSEILNCPWDSIGGATDWQKPRRGVSKANIVCAVIASEREGVLLLLFIFFIFFPGLNLSCFPNGKY